MFRKSLVALGLALALMLSTFAMSPGTAQADESYRLELNAWTPAYTTINHFYIRAKSSQTVLYDIYDSLVRQCTRAELQKRYTNAPTWYFPFTTYTWKTIRTSAYNCDAVDNNSSYASASVRGFCASGRYRTYRTKAVGYSNYGAQKWVTYSASRTMACNVI